MREMFPSSMIMVAIAAAGAVIAAPITQTEAQTPPASGGAPAPTTLNTPWGEPDLQGIWTDETDTLLQRAARYADQEFFTEAQRAELDRERSEVLGRDKRGERGTELDLAGAYNSAFVSWKRIAEACKSKAPICSGGKYDPTPSPRRAELPPRFSTGGMNRSDGPEDSSLAERCLTGGLPDFGVGIGSFRRIVQTPGGITIFYDVGQGQGWQRNIVMNGSTHLPANIRQWYGDSRGHWEGNTLVIDVTNFTPKTDFQGSRENLRLVERWTRTSPATLEYRVTIEDPTVWTRPWTVVQEFTRQSDQENRFYAEPRCIEGNFGLPGLLHGRRMEDAAFAEGRGPDPATRNSIGGIGGFILQQDPLR